MGNRGTEWGEWWKCGECRESGWECGEPGWECGELGWECGELGWECGESGWECGYINTWQVFYKEFPRQDIPRYILKTKEKLISRNTSQQLLPRIAIVSFFWSTFNNVSPTFHIPDFNNIGKKFFSDHWSITEFNYFTEFCFKDQTSLWIVPT